MEKIIFQFQHQNGDYENLLNCGNKSVTYATTGARIKKALDTTASRQTTIILIFDYICVSTMCVPISYSKSLCASST